jgi:hypothetical protein
VSRTIVFWLACFGAFAVFWWLIVLRGAVNGALRSFWSPYYLSLHGGARAAISDTRRLVEDLAVRFVGVPAVIALVAAAYGAVVVLRVSLERGLALLAPFAAALAGAGLRVAPLGGGRTDIYLYPAFALLAAGGTYDILRRIPHILLPGVTVIAAALLITTPGAAGYPREDIRPIVTAVQSRIEPGDGVLVYHYAQFAFGLYTKWPISLVQTKSATMGFLVSIDRPDTYVLPYEPDQPGDYAPLLDRLASRYRRLWLPATKRLQDFPALTQMLRGHGYREYVIASARGATLSLFER